jgi:uncharacterized membrane protein YeaQ/YmgE (transglycosylase-associated protein family)
VTRLSERSTADLVILFLAGVIGSTLLIAMLGLVVLRFVHPEVDVDSNLRVFGDVLTVLVGAIVGYVGGKAVGKSESESENDSERTYEPDPLDP